MDKSICVPPSPYSKATLTADLLNEMLPNYIGYITFL